VNNVAEPTKWKIFFGKKLYDMMITKWVGEQNRKLPRP
jgi:hypothetical protein